MRLDTVADLGRHLRAQRRQAGLTQAGLSAWAQVSRRWLADLEAGKATAEVGLVFKVVHALGLSVLVDRVATGPDGIDLDDVLARYGRPGDD